MQYHFKVKSPKFIYTLNINGEDFSQQFTEKDIWKANKHMKWYLTSLVTKKCNLKPLLYTTVCL